MDTNYANLNKNKLEPYDNKISDSSRSESNDDINQYSYFNTFLTNTTYGIGGAKPLITEVTNVFEKAQERNKNGGIPMDMDLEFKLRTKEYSKQKFLNGDTSEYNIKEPMAYHSDNLTFFTMDESLSTKQKRSCNHLENLERFQEFQDPEKTNERNVSVLDIDLLSGANSRVKFSSI